MGASRFSLSLVVWESGIGVGDSDSGLRRVFSGGVRCAD